MCRSLSLSVCFFFALHFVPFFVNYFISFILSKSARLKFINTFNRISSFSFPPPLSTLIVSHCVLHLKWKQNVCRSGCRYHRSTWHSCWRRINTPIRMQTKKGDRESSVRILVSEQVFFIPSFSIKFVLLLRFFFLLLSTPYHDALYILKKHFGLSFLLLLLSLALKWFR